MTEASEEMKDFIDEVTLWVGEQMGGPDVLSLQDIEHVHNAIAYFMAWLLEPENRKRMAGFMGRAGFDILDE